MKDYWSSSTKTLQSSISKSCPELPFPDSLVLLIDPVVQDNQPSSFWPIAEQNLNVLSNERLFELVEIGLFEQ
ncbi:13607_t:CDS:2, partial [Gigaspora rosea]